MLIIFLGIFYVIYIKVDPTDTIPLRMNYTKIQLPQIDLTLLKGMVLVGAILTYMT